MKSLLSITAALTALEGVVGPLGYLFTFTELMYVIVSPRSSDPPYQVRFDLRGVPKSASFFSGVFSIYRRCSGILSLMNLQATGKFAFSMALVVSARRNLL